MVLRTESLADKLGGSSDYSKVCQQTNYFNVITLDLIRGTILEESVSLQFADNKNNDLNPGEKGKKNPKLFSSIPQNLVGMFSFNEV